MQLKGLSLEQVEESRRKYGNNIITPGEKISAFRIFLTKFEDPIIRILLIVAFFSIGLSLLPMIMEGKSFFECEWIEPMGILSAVILATGIGFWFEYDAHKRFDLLNRRQDDNFVKVIREGETKEISRKDVVVGDIVLLEVGDEIPADGSLKNAMHIKVDESCLTGELLCEKTTDPAHFDSEATYPSNVVLRGTKVMEGSAIFEVEKVGDATEYGKIAQQLTEVSTEKTPLNKQLEALAKKISIVGYSLSIALFLLLFVKDIFVYDIFPLNDIGSWFTYEKINRLLHYVMAAVTLVVVSVPEGLPMSVTLSLALSVRRMLKENNLVRKMHACETMGAATVICTDKTGTLTQNKMQVADIFFIEEPCFMKENMAVNSTAHLEHSADSEPKPIGNPTEGALLLWLEKEGLDYHKFRENAKVIAQQPFSTETKYMATLVFSKEHARYMIYVKGAFEFVSPMCLPIEKKDEITARLATYQDQAMRTIVFAYGELPANENISKDNGGEILASYLQRKNLKFSGILAITDPIRPGVSEAVADCMSAGIKLKVITGDTARTAIAIAKEIGLWKGEDNEKNWISGADFAALSDEDALKRIDDVKIMMRARPSDKQRMVRLLQSKGEVVALTGDGINDAPALHKAHCGLSMGSGTAVAKEASDITLLDDSFNSIVTAVKWGRSLYQNIQRFLLFQLTINVTALLMVLFGSLIGYQIPLTVTQMLWVNIIMDSFAAAALASLPPNNSVLRQKPRNNNDFIVSKSMFRFIFGSGLLFFAVLMILWNCYGDFGKEEISLLDLTKFFTVFVMLQFWNLFNAKAFFTNASALKNLFKTPIFLLVLLCILIGQFMIVTFGGKVFRTVPMTWQEWGIILFFTSFVLWIGEAFRYYYKTKQAKK